MPSRERVTRIACPAWLWALLPLLLATALVIPAFSKYAFGYDESATMLSAGARHLGPYTLTEAVTVSVSSWPDHPWGNAVIFTVWGRIVGWSEFAMRALPWLAGLLALAWVYRLGRELFTARVALTAMLLLSTSVFFLVYMYRARSYTPAMLLATICLWGYWRVALAPRPPGRGARLALLLGGAGMVYAHYFCAMLLPALGLFHLLFVRRERRWWQALWLFGLAALLALPQVRDLMTGIAFNQGRGTLQQEALYFPEVIALFVYHLSNDLVEARQPVHTLLGLALPLPLLLAARNLRRSPQLPGAALYLTLTSILLLLLLLVANEILRVLVHTRVRYLATLWPPVVLLLGMAALHPTRALMRAPLGLVLVMLPVLAGVSDFQREGELRRYFGGGIPVTIAASRAIEMERNPETLLVVDTGLFKGRNRIYEFYTGAYGEQRLELYEETTARELLERVQGYNKVVLLYRNAEQNDLRVPEHVERLRETGWFHCRKWREHESRLELLLHFSTSQTENCPQNPVRLDFEADILMTTPELSIADGRLSLDASFHSTDHALLARYSLAVHIIDPRSGLRVAQGDTGVGPGNIVPLRSEIDVSALPAGEYELSVGLYDWQTGVLLSGRDVETGASGDMHTLQHFRVG